MTTKRILAILLTACMVLSLTVLVPLADEPEPAPAAGAQFSIHAPTTMVVNKTATGSATLTSDVAYSAVQVQITMTQQPDGSNPQILATDATGTYNLANGTWGSPTGFPISEGYNATTEITLSFDKAGSYSAYYKLVDLSNRNSVITDGSFSIVVEDVTYAAQIGETKYETLTEAVAAAQDGNTVELLKDVALSENLYIQKSITLNGNGHTITSTVTNDNAVTVTASGVALQNVVIDSTTAKYAVHFYNVTGGALNSVTTRNTRYAGVLVNGSNVVVTGSNLGTAGYAGIELGKGTNVTTISSVSLNNTSGNVYVDKNQISETPEILIDGAQAEINEDGFAAVPAPAVYITDCGLWGDTYNLGWRYENFDVTAITAIQVGMLDADGNAILTYTADAEQIAYQQANGYVTDAGLSSAPFYQVYNGNALPAGRDLDWTVVKGEAFCAWQPATFYVQIVTPSATYYQKAAYTGSFGEGLHTELTAVPGRDASYTQEGMKAHYVCELCGKFFLDEEGTVEVSAEDLVIPKLEQPTEPEPTEPEETKPSEPEETKPSEPEETKPSDPEETKPSEPEETKPSEPEQTKPTTPVDPDAPATGDSTDLVMLVSLLAVSLAGVGIIVSLLLKKDYIGKFLK